MDALRIICLSICYLVSSTLAADEVVNDIYTQAASCPYRFNMGCFLDVVEKCCTGLQAVEGCINKKGKAKCDVRELGRLVGALDPKNIEALNKCCCTKAFADGYEDCKSPNPVCKKAIADHVDKDVKIHLPILKKCLKKPTKANCKPAIDSIKWVCLFVFLSFDLNFSKFQKTTPEKGFKGVWGLYLAVDDTSVVERRFWEFTKHRTTI